ncbi:hypothetical protein AVEN_214804-1 [Araneus ventricosus]|uniref:CCHC-type domain-containing protein n=1 Tax=Araneus ventricosus TaxID=182803 RepID=A0A4Y2QLQ3_ARAVE|nr:hypothetical protein AVEN_214804-1 [Araneus ventricosus]
MDSKLPPRVGRAWRPIRRVVHFGPWCINRPVSQPFGWSAQGDQAKVANFRGLALRVVNVPGSGPERIGVISESEFQRDLEDDILECLKDQKVIAVRRITIKRNNQNFPTKHVILTFNTPILPKSVKIAYMNCPVRHFIPNPLRCFKCQRFGHTITACRSKQICARCSLPDHGSNNCSSTTPKCYNCNGDHPAFFRSCPRYKQEKEILTVKITKNISFPEARKIVNDRTPKPGISYSSALNSVVTSVVAKHAAYTQYHKHSYSTYYSYSPF